METCCDPKKGFHMGEMSSSVCYQVFPELKKPNFQNLKNTKLVLSIFVKLIWLTADNLCVESIEASKSPEPTLI